MSSSAARPSRSGSLRWVTMFVSSVLALAGCRRHAAAGTAGSCGRSIAEADLWREASDVELAGDIAAAQRCASERGTHVLLEFVAPWCTDCQSMTRLDATPAVADAMRARYEHVRVNVGHWDRHRDLLGRYRIDRIAAYVVLDAAGNPVAHTVLEPVTGGHGPVTAAQWISWLESPR